MHVKDALRHSLYSLAFAGLLLVLGLSLSGPETVDALHHPGCADVDGNGTVTQNDTEIVAVFYGKQVGQQAPLAPWYVDVTGDHFVDISDIGFVAGQDGTATDCQNAFFGGPWDVNRDGFVDISDIGLVSGAVGQTVGAGDPKDLDRDSLISDADTKIVAGHYGEAVPAHPLFCPDVDGNGIKTQNDAEVVAVYYGQAVPPAPRYLDMNGDTFIDTSDIGFVAGHEDGTPFNCQTWFFGDPWDVNRDGFVDITDIGLVSGAEGQRTAAGDPRDVDRGGLGITRADTKIVSGHFGETSQY